MLTVVVRTPTGYRTESLADFEDRARRENQVDAIRRAGAVPVAPRLAVARRSRVVWVLPGAGARSETGGGK
jgi:hypothetical protein